jgi:hypothetical protein
VTFAAPALLGGLLFAAVPIVVHLIGRRSAPTIPFAPHDFLADVVQRLARREKIRQLLLLLLRIAAVVLLALALATPGYRAFVQATASADTLIVLDASASMGYQLHGDTLLSRAKNETVSILSARGEGLALVVVAGDDVTPLAASPTADRTALKDAVRQTALAQRGIDLAQAVRRGLELYGDRPVDLFVVSDLSANAFTGSGVLNGQKVQSFHLIDAAERKQPEPLGNMSIASMRTSRVADGGYQVVVSVRNFGGAPAQAELRLTLDGAARARGFLDIPPGGAVDKEFQLADVQPGEHRGEVTIASDGDGFASDDRAPVALDVFAEPKVLLVDGAPHSVSYRDELFYLERALQTAEPPVQFSTITGDDLAQTKLEGFGVIVLANLPAPSAGVASALSEFVARGGGLLIGLGDNVDFEKYNAALGAILPARLRDQWAVADPHAADAPAHALGLTDIDWNHPALRRFERSVGAAFQQSRTYRHFFVEAQDLGKTAQLMRFSSGAPALIERNHVVLWLSSLDRDFSDLAIRPPFSPLMAQLVRYLGGSLRAVPDEAAVAGERIDLALPVGVAQAWARRVAGGQALAVPSPQLRFSQPGLYALYSSASGGTALRGTTFTVLPSLDESDFSPIASRELAQRWGLAPEVAVHAEQPLAAVPLSGDFTSYAHLALVALMVAFSLQTLVARRG